MVRWLRWHCPPDTGFEIRALAVWGRARYLSVTEAPHNTNFHTWMGKKQFCFFQTAETGNRTPDSGVKGSGANHYPRAPAQGELILASSAHDIESKQLLRLPVLDQLLINPLSPHDALKHHFTSLKTDLIFPQPRVLERKFPRNWFTNTWQFSWILLPTSNHLHPLQVENCDSNSRLVVDGDDNGKLRLERVLKEFVWPCHEANHWCVAICLIATLYTDISSPGIQSVVCNIQNSSTYDT